MTPVTDTQLPERLFISSAYRVAITISGGQGRVKVQFRQPLWMD
jgi:hypothetical protein